MSAHGYFSIDKDKIKHMSFFKNGSHNRVRNGWVYKNGAYIHVWSGASVVHYYDNTTLLGTEEVDEGEDVLHPSIDTTKSNYTLVGWSTEPNDLNKQVTSLVATGEEMNLYALYLPNTRVTSNVCPLSVEATWSDKWAYGSFNVDMGKYQSGSITAYVSFSSHGTGELRVGYGQLDGVTFGESQGGGSGSRTIPASNGTHSLAVYVVSYNNYSQYGSASVIVTLTNPRAWT